MSDAIPDAVRRLFWDVEPDAVEIERHRDYVMERIMTRGTWEAMRWLRSTYSKREMADFLARKADRLPPRDRAYWALVAGHALPTTPGGGRPAWAG
jgi:ribonuclease HI